MSDSKKVQKNKIAKIKTRLHAPLLLGWMCFVLLFVVCGAWITSASISGAVIANGIVAVNGKAKSIQHVDGGVISAISVEDGQRVSKGDELLRIDDTIISADLNIYTSRLQEAVAVKSRLKAELDEHQVVDWNRSELDRLGIQQAGAIEAAQQRIFESRRNFNTSQQVRLASQVTQLGNQIEGYTAQVQSLEQKAALYDQELLAMVNLKSKGHGTETQLRKLKLSMADINGRIGEVIAERARTLNAIEEVRIQMLQQSNEFRSNVSTAMAKTDIDIQNLTQQLLATKTFLQRTTILAPADGIIHELTAHTIGGVLRPGATVLQIIPDNSDFEIEVTFDPQSVDELFIGQETVVRLTALNLRTTPELSGYISHISPDVVVDPALNRSFYRATVSISDFETMKLGENVLVPGMPVEVFASTGDRSVLTYLMQPLANQFNHAMREQ